MLLLFLVVFVVVALLSKYSYVVNYVADVSEAGEGSLSCFDSNCSQEGPVLVHWIPKVAKNDKIQFLLS